MCIVVDSIGGSLLFPGIYRGKVPHGWTIQPLELLSQTVLFLLFHGSLASARNNDETTST